MFGFGKSEKIPFFDQNLKAFERTIKGINGEGMGVYETINVSCSVYKLWQMFNVKYKSVENWKKNQDNIVEWISFLDTLAKDNIKKGECLHLDRFMV